METVAVDEALITESCQLNLGLIWEDTSLNQGRTKNIWYYLILQYKHIHYWESDLDQYNNL